MDPPSTDQLFNNLKNQQQSRALLVYQIVTWKKLSPSFQKVSLTSHFTSFDPKWPLKLLFTYYFLAIDIQLAALDPTYRPGIDPQFLTVNLGTDVDMDKLDIKILDKDGKPLNIGDPEIKQVGEVDGVPQYVLTYEGKILKSIRSSCDNAMWQWFYCDMWVNFQFLNF